MLVNVCSCVLLSVLFCTFAFLTSQSGIVQLVLEMYQMTRNHG